MPTDRDPFVAFRLDIEPRGWERPGAMIRHGRIHWYVRDEERSYREIIAWTAKAAMGAREPTAKPVTLVIHALMPIPGSWSKKKKEQAVMGEIQPTGKPDWDNLGKVIADALKGIVWVDDAAVCDGRVTKRYSDHAGLHVEIWA